MFSLLRNTRTHRRRTATAVRPWAAAALVTASAASLLTALPAQAVTATSTPAAPSRAAAAQAAALPTGWASVVNAVSGKCLDARGAGTADGTAVQQYSCNNTGAQQWSFTPTSDGYVRVANRNDANQVLCMARDR